MPSKNNILGQTFNGILIESLARIDKKSSYFYVCLCHCGNRFISEGYRIKNGRRKSCGCLWQHGMIDSGEYKCWAAMKRRCDNQNTPEYKDYGGRGIHYQPEWADFKAFIADMGTKPDKSLTLDRIDNNKGYSKDNCRWASRAIQQANRRNTKKPKPCAFCGKPFIYKNTPKQKCCSHKCRGNLIKAQSSTNLS